MDKIATIVRDAYLFANRAHNKQKRPNSKVEYIKSLEYITCIVGRYTDDPTMLAASLLHKTIDTGKTTIEVLIRMFGDRVAQLVCDVTSCQEERRLYGRKVYMLQRFNEMSSDALIIKLCSRLNNIYELMDREVPVDYINRYLEETTFILENLTRDLEDDHSQLIESILSAMLYIESNRNL